MSTLTYLKSSFSLSRFRNACLAIAVSLLLWGGAVVGREWLMEHDPNLWSLGLPQEFRPLLLGLRVLLTFLILFWVLPAGVKFLSRWGRRRFPLTGDLAVLSLSCFFLASEAHQGRWLPQSVEGFVAVVLLLFLSVRAATMPRAEPVTASEALFDKVLGPAGLLPVEDQAHDELNRGPLVDVLFGLLAQGREFSINLGVEGAWGSGKTSLLRQLRKKLEQEGFTVVALDAWNYREPERLVRAYFGELEQALGEKVLLPGIGRRLLRLGSGLADIGEGWVFRIVKLVLPGAHADSVESIRKDLKEYLASSLNPVVVLVDDLDRLEVDELQAVLRSIRLVSDLPNLAHIIAYDRRQLSLSLFPGDGAGSQARDYLAKLINVEYSIGNPPEDLASGILQRSLQPLLDEAGPVAVQYFAEKLQRQPVSVLLAALQTPREIKRIVATTALSWQQMSREVNIFDLFVLEIIHYRFPGAYSSMRESPEWFFQVQWWANPWGIAHKDKWERESRAFAEQLRKSGRQEDLVLLELLAIVTVIRDHEQEIYLGSVSEQAARKERRLVHPQIYHRYFHLYAPSSIVSESEIEDFRDQVLAALPSAERQNIVRARIEREVSLGRIESFWNQWELGFEPRSVGKNFDLALDLSLGIARSSVNLPSTSKFLRNSPRKVAAFAVMRMVAKLSTDREATDLMEAVVGESSSIDFSGYLLSYAEEPDSDVYGDRQINWDRVREVFTGQVEARYRGEDFILDAPRDELVGAIHGGANKDTLLSILEREIRAKPMQLPLLLRLGAPYSADEKEVPRVDGFNAARLDQMLPLRPFYEPTRDIPLAAWSDPIERELVKRFRLWVESPDSLPSQEEIAESDQELEEDDDWEDSPDES